MAPLTQSFYFVPASTVLSWGEKCLPRMQDLRDRGLLRHEEINIVDAFLGEGIINQILFISHRWEDPAAPDVEGAQLTVIREHLKANPNFQLVWYDWSALPEPVPE